MRIILALSKPSSLPPQVQQQIAVLANSGRRAALTAEELSSVPDNARTYNTVGRA